jgi:hypothetical protein
MPRDQEWHGSDCEIPLAQGVKACLREWGIRRWEDFVEIVFNLVDINFLGKHLEDCKEDFQGGTTSTKRIRNTDANQNSFGSPIDLPSPPLILQPLFNFSLPQSSLQCSCVPIGTVIIR